MIENDQLSSYLLFIALCFICYSIYLSVLISVCGVCARVQACVCTCRGQRRMLDVLLYPPLSRSLLRQSLLLNLELSYGQQSSVAFLSPPSAVLGLQPDVATTCFSHRWQYLNSDIHMCAALRHGVISLGLNPFILPFNFHLSVPPQMFNPLPPHPM